MGELKFELNKARLALADVYQLMADLVIVEQARDANYVAATQAQDKAVANEVALAHFITYSVPRNCSFLAFLFII